MTTWVTAAQPSNVVAEILGTENGNVLGTEGGNILAGVYYAEWTNATVVTDVWVDSAQGTATWVDAAASTGSWTPSAVPPLVVAEAILLETGGYLIQEDGGHILDEQSGPVWVNS